MDDTRSPEERGSADPVVDRTLTLLWRRSAGAPRGSRGPRQRVSVDEVIAAAIALADSEGLSALSMRKVADKLGLGVMSMYTYVPGKAELIGLMVDEVMGEADQPAYSGTLRDRMTEIARQLWDEFHRHPWLLHVQKARPWIGPNGSARYEWQLAAIEGVGLGDLEMDHTIAVLAGFAESSARSSIEAAGARTESGMTDQQWWEINSPVLERLMEGRDYPISSRVGRAAGEAYNSMSDPASSFEFGLARIIDGIEALLRR
ncbi:TetR/AcrR family transcriptional regulator [Williamsia sp. 1135]|uniref:TetR/AcrR family transcriptional regulator n=1 Tax=Williamsia sp. 1135 TaxID=1889262 RepID=UPI000A103BCA|nr:TetR/AcrR family transcriptional regulator [Williamsia sp. 1135]ORM26024.1 TetR family transcriptional regulator [Williamsia sp. 1135]